MKENRINKLLKDKKNILSIYFTAGFPKLGDTTVIIDQLQKSGVDMIEIGIPFSDPLADGPIIQHSSEVALKNGMSLKLVFEQLEKFKVQVSKSIGEKPETRNQKPETALLLMGYLNPVLQFGVENFCKQASQVGISGVILPDLPIDEYLTEYKPVFEKYNLKNIFLITPQTSENRIRYIDENSDGFIYMVASSSTTGTKTEMDDEKEKYFQRVKAMNLKNPFLVGFGIGNKSSFSKACQYANGAIIGSAFVKAIEGSKDLKQDIHNFIKSIK